MEQHILYSPRVREKKRVVMIGNHEIAIFNFRRELVEELIKQNYEVYLFSPKGSKIDLLVQEGCVHIEIDVNRHGTNLIEDVKLWSQYYKYLKQVQPDVVLTYTIKPNIYGGLAARLLKIPYIVNVTGLGIFIENKTLLQSAVVKLYAYALRKAELVFFQNEKNRDFFLEKEKRLNFEMIPGSGVNIKRFSFLEYPENGTLHFLFLGRVMKDKGIEEYLSAAKSIQKKYPKTSFHIAGFIEEDYQEIINSEVAQKNIIYHGFVENVPALLKEMNCLVLPSYHEGMSTVLLEASACGRPVIASDIFGCKEIIEPDKTGFLCEERNSESLSESIIKFIELGHSKRRYMGETAWIKVSKQFDRQIIVDAYLKRIGESTDAQLT